MSDIQITDDAETTLNGAYMTVICPSDIYPYVIPKWGSEGSVINKIDNSILGLNIGSNCPGYILRFDPEKDFDMEITEDMITLDQEGKRIIDIFLHEWDVSPTKDKPAEI